MWDSSAVHLVFFVCLRSCNNSQWVVNGPSFAPPLMNIKQQGKSEKCTQRGREICQNIRGVDRQKTPDGKEGEICMMVQIQSFAQRSTVARLLERKVNTEEGRLR